jgi:hypothetical protein
MVSTPHSKDKTLKSKTLTICCLQEMHLTDKNKHLLRVKGWEKISKQMDPESRQE